jgi:hypothetical protein
MDCETGIARNADNAYSKKDYEFIAGQVLSFLRFPY